MESYAKALSYAVPFFIVLILIEYLVSRLMKKPVNNSMDTIASLSSGMTNTLKSLLGISIVIISYNWMVTHLSLFQIQSSLLVYILAFIGIDFAGYWSHRWNHEINLFWNRHVVHHSSEEFNLSCALRQEISELVAIYFFLYVPLALIGIPTKVIAIVTPIHLFAQFWYHTKLISKLGILEHIIVTPSHHRVHHAINDEYIDKNYAPIFILWDKWFGTFQQELPHVKAVYGTLKQAHTWNPIIINFQHLWRLIKDAWRTKNWVDKVKIWFMPTGWRPRDVTQQYPIEIDGVYTRQKYDSKPSNALQYWSWFQLIVNNLLLYYILISLGQFEYWKLILYMAFIFLSIFAYTSLMDKHKMAIFFESIKLILGISLLFITKGWFNIDAILPGLTILVGIYIIASFLATIYFLYLEKNTLKV